MYSILITLFTINLFHIKNVKAYVKCPYCDPNHMAYPNLEEAMRLVKIILKYLKLVRFFSWFQSGYDVPMGNPNPGHGNTDPGIRNQIFNPMIRNNDAHYQLDKNFVTANAIVKCDAAWNSKVVM